MKRARATTGELIRDAEGKRRKRLGQYFSGVGLGRVLAALAQAEKAKSIVDPMAGSGDLLASCLEVGAKPELLAGIEIDEPTRDICVRRLPTAQCLLGSAFDPKVLSRLASKSWDLVIANPPYVRYQSLSEKTDADRELPSAAQIRTDLLQDVELLPALDTEDKRLFTKLIAGYSGLSDLAVPSWILCAGLVKQGGRLALVAPESWLSRNYATVVHYLLFRWFDIEFVVEDEHACWFEDAQVKTSLIVAKRVRRRAPLLTRPEGSVYCHISISAAASTPESPIGQLALPRTGPEKNFAKQARLWLRNASSHTTALMSARPVSIELAHSNLIAATSRQKWFYALEGGSQAAVGIYVPHEIHDWLSRHQLTPVLETFDSQGVAVGQGLRTGANGFFYAGGTCRAGEVALVFAGPLTGLTAKAPLTIARPVIRRQSELPEGFVVSPSLASGWLLDLRSYALPEDIEAEDLVLGPYEVMPDEVANIVRAAAQANFGSDVKPQRVWELTAVSPNIRPATGGAAARRWYMLPDFAPRHLPDVLIARVNSAIPKAYLNENRGCIIDANFSTMWILPVSMWCPHGLVAFMNSVWARAVMETSGAVMGGGALKLEAAHLRRFPVPSFDKFKRRRLNDLGTRLVATPEAATEVMAAIDETVAQALGCKFDAIAELRDIAFAGQARRAKQNGRR